MNTITVLRCAAAGAILLLAGCSGGDLTRTFGLTRDAPDEFTVTTRAPLSMPPDFTLRPPQPGVARPQEETTTQEAETAVAGPAALASQASGADSPGQDALIAAAGPPPPPGIRATVDAEAIKAATDLPLSEELMFWKEPPPPGTPLDAQKEAQRLQQNAALGKGVDSGATPTISTKPHGLFDWLF